MKLQYLGFLPAIIFFIWSWTPLSKPLDEFGKTDSLADATKLAIRIVFSLALFVSGLIWGLS